MIANKTLYFTKVRQSAPTEFIPTVSAEGLRNSLKALNVEIASFNNKLERSNLPSFNLKERRSKEIKDAREKIECKIKEIDKMIKDLIIPEKIQHYFLTILKRLLILYRNVEQKHLARSEAAHDIDHQAMYNGDAEECMAQDLVSRNSAIRSSIFNLSSSIVQLKMVLKSQTSMIDTIDFYFDKANTYLEEANKEIDRIPGKYTGFKDVIIHCLLYLICILLCLVLIKTYKNRPKPPL